MNALGVQAGMFPWDKLYMERSPSQKSTHVDTHLQLQRLMIMINNAFRNNIVHEVILYYCKDP